MVRRVLPCLAVLACSSAFITPAGAQDISVVPAHVSRVDGQVTLDRSGQVEASPLNMPVVGGDHLRTAAGRMEIMLADGGTLALDSDTAVDFQSGDLVRLKDGRVRLTIPAPMKASSFRVDSPSGSIRVTEAGEYRVSLLHGDSASPGGGAEAQVELAVVYGAADLFTDEGSTRVRPGESAYASAGLLPSEPYAFNTASTDDFERWAEGQPEERAGASSQYLPPDLREYATTFDSDGDWQYLQPYGYVWYPRVSVGWRPYYNGRWMSYPRYGWTWIGADAFAWPTHHFGRWGVSSGAWFWIPESHWAPAHVSWAYAPGYVSWCPLGFDNRPVVGFSVTAGRRAYSPWTAWTVVASSHFGRGFVPERVVRTDTWSRGAHPAFEVRPRGPSVRDVAVPRYVNRGDTIVQSQTARPAAPARVPARDAVTRRGPSPPIAASSASVARRPQTSTLPSSIPVYRGTVTRTPEGRAYRTPPPATPGTPARTRRTNPVYAPDYSPHYQPNYGARTQPNGMVRPPVVIRGTPPATAPRTTAPPPSGRAIMRSAPPAAAPAARPAPPAAGRGGAVAVPRHGRGGGGGDNW
jgi:hypothetical protein